MIESGSNNEVSQQHKPSLTEKNIVCKLIISQAVHDKYGLTKASIFATDLYLAVKEIGIGSMPTTAMEHLIFGGSGICKLSREEDKESLEILEWIKANEDSIIKEFWKGRGHDIEN
jgi:hypothetical protein